jgi:hypothetical protein
MKSPAEIEATCPTTGTKSRLPRAFTFRTGKPLDGPDEGFLGRSSWLKAANGDSEEERRRRYYTRLPFFLIRPRPDVEPRVLRDA